MIVILLNNYNGKLIKIDVPFLRGDLEEEINMDCPQGLKDAKEDKYVKLIHTIYGIVQSARQFLKNLVNGVKNMVFNVGYLDPSIM